MGSEMVIRDRLGTIFNTLPPPPSTLLPNVVQLRFKERNSSLIQPEMYLRLTVSNRFEIYPHTIKD